MWCTLETVTTGAGAAPNLSAARATNPEFRPDIEGMRAIAVVAVLLFHVRLPAFGGGFTGVDIFNVISGFLITGLLVREVKGRGTIDLPRFYFRRVRRLLPAGLLVILLTLIASYLILSPIRFPTVAGDGAWSALYAANYRFALAGTDYLASAADPSPYQHFWSLAVEEQFYLIWPALILLSARLVGAARVGIVLAGVTLASFLFSLSITDISAPWAFFSLPTRAWELGAGGLVAVGIAGRLPARLLPAAGLVGLLMVVGGVLFINDTMPYPGTAALVPVLGTMLLIIGASDAAGTLARGLGSRWPKFLGGISYSLYLWHWPLIILVPIALADDSLGLRVTLGIVAIVFATISTRFIEAPFRFGKISRTPALRGALAGLAASIIVGATAIAAGNMAPDPFGDDGGPDVAIATPRPRPTRRPTPAPVVTLEPSAAPLVTPSAPPGTQPSATEPPTPPPPTEPPASPAPTSSPSPTAMATQEPPTQAPPTQAPPTQAPPTQAPPTQAPQRPADGRSPTGQRYRPPLYRRPRRPCRHPRPRHRRRWHRPACRPRPLLRLRPLRASHHHRLRASHHHRLRASHRHGSERRRTITGSERRTITGSERRTVHRERSFALSRAERRTHTGAIGHAGQPDPAARDARAEPAAPR